VKDCYDVAFACDTDHDRHGIVTRGSGPLPSHHYLSVASMIRIATDRDEDNHLND